MSARLHTHKFRGQTTLNDGHVHYYDGETSVSPDVRGHTHRMNGRTTINDNHLHGFGFTTGPEENVNGGHDHYYRGITTYNDGHRHSMEGYTSVYQ